MKRVLILILIIASGIAGALKFAVQIIKRAMGLILHARRAMGMLIIIALCLAGFLSIRGALPFMAVFGTSMEPELHAGNLILIEDIEASDVKVGDIIVFSVPSAVRDYYNYPAVVAHRVLKVRTGDGGITFRTKGDNAGEDPFSVRPQDLLGQVSEQIPYLGFPFLFFQSQQGLIFIVIALLLLALYLYADELSRGRKKIHQGIFAPVIQENRNTSEQLEQRIDQRIDTTEKELERRVENTEKTMEFTQQALNNFAAAMAEYAEHLKSHTSAIQGLSEASHELKNGAAEQNKVLGRMLELMEQASPASEITERKAAHRRVEEQTFPPGCARRKIYSDGDE